MYTLANSISTYATYSFMKPNNTVEKHTSYEIEVSCEFSKQKCKTSQKTLNVCKNSKILISVLFELKT